MTLILSSFALALLAFILAWPLPILLDRANWTFKSPGYSLIFWQAVAIGGGVSMLGSLVLFGISPFGTGPTEAFTNYLNTFLAGGVWPKSFTPIHGLSLATALLLLIHLMLNLLVTVFRTAKLNRNHRAMLELLSNPVAGERNTRVLENDIPIAYCIPGAIQSYTVVSAGLIRRLSETQLQAVIEHEKAHLNQQHTTVLTVFSSWASALPWFPIATRAKLSVELLVEALADDIAAKSTGPKTVAEAITVVTEYNPTQEKPTAGADAEWEESSGSKSTITALQLRVERLVPKLSPLNSLEKAAVVTIAAFLVMFPGVLLLWDLFA